jgi:hypothetical protein
MPKRYKIEMTLTEDTTPNEERGGKQVDRDAFKVDHDTEEEAKKDFRLKVKAARETGKPPV